MREFAPCLMRWVHSLLNFVYKSSRKATYMYYFTYNIRVFKTRCIIEMSDGAIYSLEAHNLTEIYLKYNLQLPQIQIQIQILYSLRITACNQHEVHNLTRLFCYNNTKWLIDLGREKSQF